MPSKTASRRSVQAAKTPSAVEIVVRRGAGRRFEALQNRTSELPVVVSWDRRKTERRTKPHPSMEVPRDRRASDRRQKPPFTWELADFVVVVPESKRRRKAKTTKG